MKFSDSHQKDRRPISIAFNKIQTRFIFFSILEDKIMSNLMVFMLFISYAQIFFQTTQIARRYLPKDQEGNNLPVLQIMENIFTIDNSFSYDQYDGMLVICCLCIIIYICLLILNFLIITYGTFRPIQARLFEKSVWPTLINLHIIVLCFPINNVCNRMIVQAWNNELRIFSKEETNTMCFYIAIAIYLINNFFSVLPFFLSFNVLPGKYSLSSKDFIIDQITLSQKTLTSLFVYFLPSSSLTFWFLICLSVILSIMRLFWYLYCLPRYNFRTLILDLHCINLCILASVVALSIFSLNQIFYCNIHMITFTKIVCLLSPLVVIYSDAFFKQTIKKVILLPVEQLNPFRALHKVLTLKFLERSMNNPNRRTEYFDINYFFFATLQSSTQNILGQKNYSDWNFNLSSKDQQKELKRKCLENLVNTHSKYDLFKLILARFYARNLKLYIIAIKTLARIKSHSYKIQPSARLLKLQIQEQMQSRNGGSCFTEYFTFIKQKKVFEEEMKQQLNYQYEFWKEVNKDKPEIMKLQRLSELIHHKKARISIKWNRLQKKFNEGINCLYSLYGCYQYLLNDSTSKGKEYMKKYNLFNEKYVQQQFINASNLYDHNNFSLTIRTHSDSIGTISECSNNIKRILGYDKDAIIGINIGNMISSYLAERHNGFIQDYIKTGYSVFFGRFRVEFIKNSLGYLQKVSLWTNIHPFIDNEVQLTGLFRPIHDLKEYLFVTPQGYIDSYTKGIASKLGIQDKKIHIKTICPKFSEICEVNTLGSENENGRLSSKENLLVQGRKSISPSENTYTHLLAQKGLLQQEQTLIKLKANQMDCSLEFKTCFFTIKNQKPNYLYQCQAKTINFKETFIISIEIEMVDKEKETNLRTRNMRKKVTQSIQKYKTLQVEETIEDYNTGTAELLFPTNSCSPLDQKFPDWQNSREGMLVTFQTKSDMHIQNTSETPIVNLHDSSVSKKHENFSTNNKKNIEKLNKHNQGENSVSGGSVSTIKQKQIHVEDIFEVKYYPKAVITFTILLALIFMASLLLQISLQIKINKDLKKSHALATTLILATQRADALCQIGRGARGAYFSQKGYLPEGSATSRNNLISFVNNLRVSSPPLKDTNAKLQQAIQDVDVVFQQKFKAVNVRIYDVNSDYTPGTYQLFNTFTAINVLIEKVLKSLTYFDKHFELDMQDLYYILINCVNDILVGTGDAVSLILDNSQVSFQDTVRVVKICRIINMSLLCVEALLVILFLFQVYIYELDLAQQYMGLSPDSLKLIQNRLEYFEKVFQNDDLEEIRELDWNTPLYNSKKLNVYAKKQVLRSEKSLKKNSLQRFYLKKILIFLLVLSLYTVALYVSLQEISNKTDSLRLKVNALTKTQSFLYETAILAFTMAQILCGDTLVTVRNLPPEQEFAIVLKNFLQGGYDLLDAFTEKDGTYDPLIAPFFFENACKFIPSNSSSKATCINIVKESTNFGIFSLFTRHHGMMRDIYQDYLVSNKTFPVLSLFVQRNVANIVPSTALIRELIQVMIIQIQNNFNEFWEVSNTTINTLLSIGTVFLSLFGIITWKLMLKHFSECSNRFKRMMRMIPFHILIKNPTLKGTLMITSRRKLLKLKNYI